MLDWIIENGATIAVSAVLIAVVGIIVFKMIKDKKAGKSGCSCGCGNCAMKDVCHSDKK